MKRFSKILAAVFLGAGLLMMVPSGQAESACLSAFKSCYKNTKKQKRLGICMSVAKAMLPGVKILAIFSCFNLFCSNNKNTLRRLCWGETPLKGTPPQWVLREITQLIQWTEQQATK